MKLKWKFGTFILKTKQISRLEQRASVYFRKTQSPLNDDVTQASLTTDWVIISCVGTINHWLASYATVSLNKRASTITKKLHKSNVVMFRFQNRRMKQKKRMKEKNFAGGNSGGVNLTDNASDDSSESPSPVHTVASSKTNSANSNNNNNQRSSSIGAKDDFSFTRL